MPQEMQRGMGKQDMEIDQEKLDELLKGVPPEMRDMAQSFADAAVDAMKRDKNFQTAIEKAVSKYEKKRTVFD